MAQTELYQRVRAHLIGLGLQPGDKIEPEIELAKRLGVSRHHIRQVLTAMVQGGILDRVPKRGTVIRAFDSSSLSDHIRFQFEVANFDVAEFKEARILVERAALPLTVRRITPSEIVQVEETIERMIEFQEQPEKADVYDRDFHVLLFRASGNRLLESFTRRPGHPVPERRLPPEILDARTHRPDRDRASSNPGRDSPSRCSGRRCRARRPSRLRQARTIHHNLRKRRKGESPCAN